MLRWLRARLATLGTAPAGAGAAPESASLRSARQRSGDQAEIAALAHLRSAGLTLIARNYLARGGELDLVMREASTLVFVEVRYRAQGGHGDGLDSVATSKQRRLITAARQFLADHPKYARWTTRFDVIALGAGGLRWVKDAIHIDQAAQ